MHTFPHTKAAAVPAPGPSRRSVLALPALLLAAGCAGRRRLSAEQIAVLKQQGFQPHEDNWELALADKMLFDSGSDQLKPVTQEAISKTGAALTAVGIRNIRVEGHTDNVGADDYNLALSRRRAAVVAKSMDAKGVTGQIQIVGMGKKVPVADNSTEAGRAENRRVVVIVPSDQE